MNVDHFVSPGDVADIVALAFNKKIQTRRLIAARWGEDTQP
jgi:hypothetical protein